MPMSNLRKIGWFAVLLVCTALYATLHLAVNSVKSQVRLAERQIVALERQKFHLETEFLTRANQRQLALWNEVEFGFQAPSPEQYLPNQRALAMLGSPRAPSAPEPIRVANAPLEAEEPATLLAMVSPLTGRAMAAEMPQDAPAPAPETELSIQELRAAASRSLAERLSHGGVRISLSATRGAE